MKGKCKFYNANTALTKKCDAGINVRELVGGKNFGWLLRTPCFKYHETDITCGSFELITEDEMAKREERITRKADAYLNASLMVSCPYCNNRFDLFFYDDDNIFTFPIFNNKWNDLKGQDVECPRCEKEFLIDQVEW